MSGSENTLTELPRKGDIVKLADSKLAEVIEVDPTRMMPICIRTLEGRARWCTKERLEYVSLTPSQVDRIRAEIARASENQVPETSAYAEAVQAQQSISLKQNRDEVGVPNAVVCRETQLGNRQGKNLNDNGVSLLDAYAISQKLSAVAASNATATVPVASIVDPVSKLEMPAPAHDKSAFSKNTTSDDVAEVEAELHASICQPAAVPFNINSDNVNVISDSNKDLPFDVIEVSTDASSIQDKGGNDVHVSANPALSGKPEQDIEFSEFIAVGTSSNCQTYEWPTSEQEPPVRAEIAGASPCVEDVAIAPGLDPEFEFTDFVSAVPETASAVSNVHPPVHESSTPTSSVLGIRSDAARMALAELVSSELEDKSKSDRGPAEDIIQSTANPCDTVSSEPLTRAESDTINLNEEAVEAQAPTLKEDCANSMCETAGPTSLADKNGVNSQSITQGAAVGDTVLKMLEASAKASGDKAFAELADKESIVAPITLVTELTTAENADMSDARIDAALRVADEPMHGSAVSEVPDGEFELVRNVGMEE
eukprot:CAMPEP_0169410110 /NCGR_PEP_ID=MMETSP1017-20121227/59604_1 /TAXON_ID=342587 /ORGANISM="Karlodinium micrum, Strain CCMP2283" /LENGTH=540 /DNA_ID=CAMNT_0009517349 /DNA_START=135 /DNA_END=1754 /DNA_ORIENTATION=+